LLDQVLRLHRELGLSVSTDHEQHAELVEEVALEPAQSQTSRLAARGNERAHQGLEFLGLRDGNESLRNSHRLRTSSA
jgi:hypothetical protein